MWRGNDCAGLIAIETAKGEATLKDDHFIKPLVPSFNAIAIIPEEQFTNHITLKQISFLRM